MVYTIEKVGAYLSEEDENYLIYVKAIATRLKIKPEFILEEKVFQEKPLWSFFEDYDLYTISKKEESILNILEEKYDLLFVKYKKQLFGKSVPEWMLSDTSKLRFWVYKEGAKIDIRRVCLPIDFSERSIKQVEFAEYLKNFFDFDYDLVYAMNMERLKGKLSKTDYDKSLSDKKEEVIQLYTDMFAEKEFNLTMLEGDPYKEMVKYINSSDYDLVVIGRRGKGMRERIGSVSLHMVRSLKCPVVVL